MPIPITLASAAPSHAALYPRLDPGSDEFSRTPDMNSHDGCRLSPPQAEPAQWFSFK